MRLVPETMLGILVIKMLYGFLAVELKKSIGDHKVQWEDSKKGEISQQVTDLVSGFKERKKVLEELYRAGPMA